MLLKKIDIFPIVENYFIIMWISILCLDTDISIFALVLRIYT